MAKVFKQGLFALSQYVNGTCDWERSWLCETHFCVTAIRRSWSCRRLSRDRESAEFQTVTGVREGALCRDCFPSRVPVNRESFYPSADSVAEISPAELETPYTLLTLLLNRK